jgi:hypothetical protein
LQQYLRGEAAAERAWEEINRFYRRSRGSGQCAATFAPR